MAPPPLCRGRSRWNTYFAEIYARVTCVGYELYEYVGRLLCVDPHQWRLHPSVVGCHSERHILLRYTCMSHVYEIYFIRICGMTAVCSHTLMAPLPLCRGGSRWEAYLAEIYMHESRVWDIYYTYMWDDCCVKPYANIVITPLMWEVTVRGRSCWDICMRH